MVRADNTADGTTGNTSAVAAGGREPSRGGSGGRHPARAAADAPGIAGSAADAPAIAGTAAVASATPGTAAVAPAIAGTAAGAGGEVPRARFREVAPLTAAGRTPSRLVHLLAPAAIYLTVRGIGVAVLAMMVDRNGLLDELSSWDGDWLLAIARYGYADVPFDMVDAFGGRTPDTPLAFFPGYPGAAAAFGLLTGGDLVLAGLLVSAVAGVFAAYGLVRLGELVPGGSRRAGLLLVGLFAAAPMAVVLSMTYTEALYCALAAWALVGVLRGQWLLAGACAAGAGLVRPTASALVAAVGLAALAAVLTRRDGVRPWIGGALATTGLLGYLAYVAGRTGALGGWFTIQNAGWGTAFDGGATTVGFTLRALAGSNNVFDALVVGMFVGSLVLLAIGIRTCLPWPLLVYAALVLITVWGSDGVVHSRPRLLLSAFVLLLPVAVGLANRRTGTAVAVIGAAALASAWFGGFALTIWPYGI